MAVENRENAEPILDGFNNLANKFNQKVQLTQS